MGKIIDLVGKKFGKLIVVKRDGTYIKPNGTVCPIWLCKCECGSTVFVEGANLRSGNTGSCGRGICHGNSLDYGESSFNSLFANYKCKAKDRGIVFKLSKKRFRDLTQQDCFYCGKKPSQIVRKSQRSLGEYTYNGVDRIDSSKGYFANNVVACCGRCNEAKMDLSQEDFSAWVEKVYLYMKGK